MADIAMVYDRSETDELGIKLTAQEMGVELDYIPFYKVGVGFSNGGYTYRSSAKDYTKSIERVKVVLNRGQSKSRRYFSAAIFEALDKEVLNPLSVELSCGSKIRTMLALFQDGIKIPKTIFVPCNVQEDRVGGGLLDNRRVITKLISHQLGRGKVVTKPDAGTHGVDVRLSEDHEALWNVLDEISPSIINPSGVVAQEFIPKWFYDLRIVVEKEKGKPGFCHHTGMARGGLKDFRTNTYLGNMVFRIKLPQSIRREAVKCGEALGEGAKSWVLALDAMPYIGEDKNIGNDELNSYFCKLEGSFSMVKKVKQQPEKKKNFPVYSKNIEDAYTRYMSTESYASIQAVIEESLKKKQNTVLFHEGNACAEFWEQTRIVGGINIAESLLRCAQSLLDN
jgi:glutathione synthase/RimK-type ligase-like ATP-grasp enzyme